MSESPLIRIILVLVVWTTSKSSINSQPPKEVDAQISALISQLADDKFAKRMAASRELEAIGEKALPALRRAAAASKDIDFEETSKKVIRAILLGCRKGKTSGLETALIEPGEFVMGSPANEQGRRPDESPHKVRLTRPFLLGTREVTQEEYEKWMKVNPSWFSLAGGGKDRVAKLDTKKFPVERVTWFDAIDFCNRLSVADGYEAYYKLSDPKREGDSIKNATVTVRGGNGYRLPTEAEWEFACRAKATTRFHFGNSSTGLEGNIKSLPPTGYGAAPRRPDVGRTCVTGDYPSNGYGLHDMHGNVAEWCWDWYDKDFYTKSPVDDPIGSEKGTHRILRGGSWLVSNASCRSASRLFHVPDEQNYYVGFRVARTP